MVFSKSNILEGIIATLAQFVCGSNLQISLLIRNETSFHLEKVSHGTKAFMTKYFNERSFQKSLCWFQADFLASHVICSEREPGISVSLLGGSEST